MKASAGLVAGSLLVSGVLAVWGTGGPVSGQPGDALWHHRNLGKAFYENPTTHQQAVDEFKKALDLAPASARERINYGLALVRAGKTADGVAQLLRAQQLDPAIPHTWFNLGIAFKKASEYDKAVAQFEQMVRLVPDEPISHFNLGYLYKLTDKPADAMREFERASALDANFAAPRYQLVGSYRDADRMPDAQRELQVFQDIKRRQAGAAVAEDVDWSVYAEILDTLDPANAQDDAPAAALRFTLFKELGRFAIARAGLIVIDADADGRPDLLAWSEDTIALFRNGETRLDAAVPHDVKGIRSIAAGDYNNDGLPDLCVVTDSGPVLYENPGGAFRRSTVAL